MFCVKIITFCYACKGFKPFNVFARIGSGAMVQDNMIPQQKHLGTFQDRY